MEFTLFHSKLNGGHNDVVLNNILLYSSSILKVLFHLEVIALTLFNREDYKFSLSIVARSNLFILLLKETKIKKFAFNQCPLYVM